MTGLEQATASGTGPAAGLLEEPTARGRQRRGSTLRALARSPLAVLSFLWLIAVIVLSATATAIAPYPASRTDLAHVLAGPSGRHWLGTDQLGRDVLSRLMFGGGDVLVGAAETTLVFVLVGTILGVLAGYFGRWVDWAVLRWIEITVALPGILILLVILAVFPGNQHFTMAVLGVLCASGLARILRAETQRTRSELYISAARVSGLSDWQILRRHIVSRLTTTILVQAALVAGAAVGVQAGLAFLGLSTQEPAPSWGGLIATAGQVIDRDGWLLVPSGGAIGLTMLAFALLGDALRDVTVGRWSPSSARRRRSDRGTAEPLAKPAAASPETGATADQPTAEALLAVQGLTVSFTTNGVRSTVVQDVSLSIERGETLGIVGESGCGKSVTVAALLGLLPRSAEVRARSCTFDAAELLTLSDKDRRSLRGIRIGYVSQEPMTALDPTTRVGNLLAEAVRQHHGLGRRAARARAVELLALVNIPDPAAVSRRYPHQISGGMAQRVAIALALAGDPELLVADEPTTALDVRVQAEILALLRRLQADMGLAIILITHDWGVAAQFCSRTVVMYAGQVVEQGPIRELYHSPAHPYTAGLLAANPHRVLDRAPDGDSAPPRPLRLPGIAGSVPAPADWPISCHFQARCQLVTADCTRRPIPLVEVTADHQSRCLHVDLILHLKEGVS
jgi:peptide/nickel transport system permease protein